MKAKIIKRLLIVAIAMTAMSFTVTGERTCDGCGGSGSKTCSSCNGKPYYKCAKCGGSGQVTFQNKTYTCGIKR